MLPDRSPVLPAPPPLASSRPPTFRRNALLRAATAVVALLAAGLVAFEIAVHAAHLDVPKVATVTLPAVASPTPAPTPLADIGRAALGRVVTIEAELPNEESLGTGWLFDTHGDFVTNAHVVAGQIALRITDRQDHTHVAIVLGVDPSNDIALLRSADGFTGSPLPVDTVALTSVPISVIALASSRATGHGDMTTDQIVGLHQEVPLENGALPTGSSAPNVYHDMLHLSGAEVYQGNSGGPVLNAKGQVIGILTLSSPGLYDSYAIPIVRVLSELTAFATRSG